MDCKEIKDRLFEAWAQNNLLSLEGELAGHVAGCSSCSAFYYQVLKPGFEQVEQEKQSLPGLYFTNKTLLRMRGQPQAAAAARLFSRPALYVASVLLAGLFTGLLMNGLGLATVSDSASAEQTSVAEAPSTTINPDHAILTLNNW